MMGKAPAAGENAELNRLFLAHDMFSFAGSVNIFPTSPWKSVNSQATFPYSLKKTSRLSSKTGRYLKAAN